MRTETPNLGDEVRFAPSPDVIGKQDGQSEQGYHPDLVKTQASQEHPLRMQVITNKQGFLELNLSQYDLHEIPSEVYNFSRLEVLLVNNNHLHNLPAAISYLRRLRKLDAHHNALHTLPDTLVNCTHLHELDFSHNKLATFPRQLTNLHSLRTLRLNHNQYTSLPHELGELENLRHLDLKGNSLWHLPFSFHQLKQLQILDLSENAFDQLPICVCSMKHLEHLDLHGNRLINLPSDLETLKELQNLNLASNHFETVPYAISNLKNLQSLNLAHNKIKSLPARMNRLAKLKILMAQGNSIGSVPNNLENVEYLNVTNNNLHNFSVAHMKKLRYLNANTNYLENLPLGICNVMPLEVLKLNNNRISYVSQDIVLLKKLRTLHLANNRLTSLPQCINELENLESFNVKGNKLDTKVARRDMQLQSPSPPLQPPVKHKQPKQKRHKSPPKPDLVQQITETQLDEEEDDVWFDEQGRLTHDPMPKPRKKPKPKRPIRKNKYKQISTPVPKHHNRDRSTQYEPHSRHISTQYTPKSSAKYRERPPLDYQSPRQPSPDILQMTKIKSPKSRRSVPHIEPIVHVSNDRDLETALLNPVSNSPNLPDNIISLFGKKGKHDEPQSLRSTAATVNDTVGDSLSLGEEDFEFQPTTVKDNRLLGVCNEIEAMLNKQLMQPITHRGIFRKSLNEDGTLKTLNSIGQGSMLFSHQGTLGSPDSTIPLSDDVFMRAAVGSQSNLLQRTKADVFKVTPAGGLFKSSIDANVTLYFPVQATEENVTIIMQLEKVSQDALEESRRRNSRIGNILSMGHIVHISMDKEINFNEQVTLSIPAPPSVKRGKLHILTYHEDNTCTPCTSPYKVYRGYITTQAWHFSGRGAVVTRAHSHHRACKSVEKLLHHAHI